MWAMGTSAEFASFDESERGEAVETVVQAVEGRVPVIANISDASTRIAIRHARRARAAGAVALAATPPYYYPHSQDELLRHYTAIRETVDLPLFMYNIPQTVRVRIELGTAKRLAADGVVSGIKDSQNDLEWFRQLARFIQGDNLDFALFAGTRFLIDAAILAGGTGAIPSIANAFPHLCVEAYEAAVAGDWQRASAAESRIMEAEAPNTAFPLGSRNAGVLGLLKALLHERGIIDSPSLTSPLRSLTEEDRRRVADTLGDMRPSAVGQ
jgi:4-hydroxy-tetrahydrodipicolinate synthase